MSTESYRFKVGSFDCITVNDGTWVYSASEYFAKPHTRALNGLSGRITFSQTGSSPPSPV